MHGVTLAAWSRNTLHLWSEHLQNPPKYKSYNDGLGQAGSLRAGQLNRLKVLVKYFDSPTKTYLSFQRLFGSTRQSAQLRSAA